MQSPTILSLILTLSLLTISTAEAKIYQWKDAAGITHYSATPPKPTEKISDLKDDLRITDNKAVAYKGNENKHSTKSSKQKMRSEKTRKRNFCDGQRRNLALLKRNLKVKWIENGKSTELNAEQRQDKLRELENSISNDCSYGDEAERENNRKNKLNEKSEKAENSDESED